MRKSDGTMRVPELDTGRHIHPHRYTGTVRCSIFSARQAGDGTLMDELVEGVLSVGSWFSPDNGPSVVVHSSPLVSDVLSIGLHVALDNKHVSVQFRSHKSSHQVQL